MGNNMPSKKVFFIGLRQKFSIAFLCFIFIPFIIVSSAILYMTNRIIENKLKSFTVQTLEQAGKNVDYHIEQLDKITTCTISNENVLDNIKRYSTMSRLQQVDANFQIRNWLTSISDFNENISGIYIFDCHDNIFYSKGRSPRLNYHAQNEEWYRKTVEASGSLKIFGTHNEFHVGSNPNKVITISRALKDFKTQNLLGVIMVDISYEFLESVFRQTDSSLYQNSIICILDENKKIIYSNDSINESLPSVFAEKMKNNSGMVQCHIQGSDSFAVYYTSGYSHWTIVSILPQAVITKDIQPVRNLIAFMLVLFFGMFLFCFIYISKRLIKPVHLMSGAIRQVKCGEYDIKFDFDTHDEISELAEGLVSMSSHINELIRKVYLAQLYQKEAELTALQNQINPHFLYNSLECVRGLALESGNKEVATMVKALSSFTRYNIYNSRDIVTIADEINQVKNYITIQNIRYSGKFHVDYYIDEKYYSYKIMKLMLQPLVENSILHGLERKMGDGHIQVVLKHERGCLYFYITDNGLGMPQEQIDSINDALSRDMAFNPEMNKTDSKSIGVLNVNNRIKLYFGNQYGLSYSKTEDGGICATIKLPAKLERDAS